MVFTLEQPEALPAANIRTTENAFPGEEFVSIENVPVFAEHETTAKDGRKLRFTPYELEAVCDRCNRWMERHKVPAREGPPCE